MEYSVDDSVKTKSLLLKSILDAAGFSPTEIKFNKNRHDFHDFVSKQLCDVEDTIYVGSKAEGIAGGFYHSGEQSDLDVILPFFPELKVYDNDFLENLSKELKEHAICSALHDREFPGYMHIMLLPGVNLYIDNEEIELKTFFLPNECAYKVVRQHLAEDLNITRDITNKFEPNGPALTEICWDNVLSSQTLVSDNVTCLRYDYWPSCANAWINRSKDTDWPPKQIIEQVKAEKCLLAPVGHFDSSNKTIQWRLSMRGENVLFEDLNNVQIYCYIMLKIVMKDHIRPLYQSDNQKDILSSYCLKNLIFWCAEKENLNWSPSNLIGCLQSCIQKLIKFLRERYMPHYIIEERNLFNSKLTPILSTSLQVELHNFKNNIMNILYLKSFETLQGCSRNFCPELLEKVTEKSIILQCWYDKISRLYFDFTAYQYFWLKYDRYPSLESIQKYKDVLNKIEKYKRKTVFKSEYTVIVSSIIGLLSYSLYRQIPLQKYILDEAIKYLDLTRTSPRSCILLRLASFFFMERKFESAIEVCSDIPRQIIDVTPPKRLWDKVYKSYNHLLMLLLSMKTEPLRKLKEAILDACYSIDIQNGLPLEYYYILSEFKNGMFIKPHFRVTYMTAEMWAVPDVLKYELLSVPEKLKTFYDDKCPYPNYDDVPAIRIHPLLNCYLLQYLCYEAIGRRKLCHEVLTKLNYLTAKEATVDENSVLFYNVVAYCNKKSGYYRKATKYILRSLKTKPSRRNAAFGYLKSMINQSLTLVREWNSSPN
ncbi:uncharacterized protein LOC127725830 [Mytilus californianus]|uniref:uncharacterized protein LOC127725830 n=1 Tax=Mytilus californianus TaxID=6549 RepID=UPI0022460E5B|nr:uncharacterized protein LOC127725830 [Mytilus californianus]